ncbi:hypothetical protein FHW36_108188 [Chitinophaga polysaccharea]|uniref:GrpE protein n=1 Tax=Chitinophaga polysaccharea TaxID=1293035 RepID=A0A561PCI0_9BACT|nr:hypothetical protein [Chitinophaga polysaccharea]TWF35832.1 hypothetical protein FHW36_108188 [Chitinophaga polysaccharea]
MDPLFTFHIRIINQVFELDKKTAAKPELASLQRNIDRIKQHFEEAGYTILNPLGEPYRETRVDYEASITGDLSDNMEIVNVIKPVVYYTADGHKSILQKGVVMPQQNKR